MKTLIKLLVISLVIIMIGCEKSNETELELRGDWIELISQKDTILFDDWDAENVFAFRRGYELVNGYMLPKYGSGIYSYKLKKDSIMLNNMVSSCNCYPAYYFHINSTRDTFQIGNFYDTSSVSTQLKTFFKIR